MSWQIWPKWPIEPDSLLLRSEPVGITYACVHNMPAQDAAYPGIWYVRCCVLHARNTPKGARERPQMALFQGSRALKTGHFDPGFSLNHT